jgi:hypothetical protein
MKQTYGTERESRGIIINRIGEPKTKIATKLMTCKLLRKCRKEEVPTCVIASTAQCEKGAVLIWIMYLLNLFLDDCKYAHDVGT